MITVYFTDNGDHACSDQSAQQLARADGVNPDSVWHISTENMIQAFRWLVVDGTIKPENITFQYMGSTIKIDKYGRFDPSIADFNQFHSTLDFMIIYKAMFDCGVEKLKLAQPNGETK